MQKLKYKYGYKYGKLVKKLILVPQSNRFKGFSAFNKKNSLKGSSQILAFYKLMWVNVLR